MGINLPVDIEPKDFMLIIMEDTEEEPILEQMEVRKK